MHLASSPLLRLIVLPFFASLALMCVVEQASATRPTARIPAAALPADVAEARAILREARLQAPAGGRTRQDIDYVLRLGAKLIRPTQPLPRRRTAALILKVNAWWYASRPAPRNRLIARLPDGLLATYWEGHGFALNPVATTGRWQGLNAQVPPDKLAAALLPYGVPRRANGTRFVVWEYYDLPDRPTVIQPGSSGMAQGRVAQLMARAYRRTGDRIFATASIDALAAFMVPVNQGGVVSQVAEPADAPRQPWYVERAYPGEHPWKGAALNGFMVSLLNLHTTGQLLRGRPYIRVSGATDPVPAPIAPGAPEAGDTAQRLVEQGAQTLATYLPRHDTGSWSLYGLLTPGWPFGTYRASNSYHCYHVSLLHDLEVISPGLGFGDYATRWNDYAVQAGVDCGINEVTEWDRDALPAPIPSTG